MSNKINIFWFRRDLRLHDNVSLSAALQAGLPVQAVFIFDKNILDKLTHKADKRVDFIHQQLEKINQELQQQGATLIVKYGNPVEIWRDWAENLPINAVYTNRDYESYGINRDAQVAQILADKGQHFYHYKDQVVFEKREVCKADGSPYVVFTPYSKMWLNKLAASKNENGEPAALKNHETRAYFHNLRRATPRPVLGLEEMGFEKCANFPDFIPNINQIKEYEEQRNFPAVEGTTRAGMYLRFGAVSVREIAKLGLFHNETFLNEIIWRDFYSQILANFPHVETQPFRLEYEKIAWLNNPNDFEAWKAGKTGYPLVDAGMRQLNQTGFMHNRVRMVVASFLVKHLLIDWRWGEAYFAEKLLDFDLASNSGGWQWAAGCGTDAAPYFRVFNPTAQQEKFDPKLKYVRQWLPEYGKANYPKPIVVHEVARVRCLAAYKLALDKDKADVAG